MIGLGGGGRAEPDRSSSADPQRRASRWTKAGRIAVAALSVAILGLTGYGWAQVQRLASGLSTADVIDPGTAASASDEQNILLLGIDARFDAQGNPLPTAVLAALHAGTASDGGDNTDTMIVIHVPAAGGKITVISIPRDSYVTLAGGFGKHKINSAYTYGKDAASDTLREEGVTGAELELRSSEAGARTAIQTVEQLTGLTINHYVAVGIDGFYNISQAVGGVQVCLNAAVHDSYSGVNLPAGVQMIQGSQALAFVRQRHGLINGDLDRIRRQQVFMAGLARTMLSGQTLADPTRLSALIDAVQKTLTLDRGWDVVSFLQELQGIGTGDIEFDTIPTISSSLRIPDGGIAVQIDPRQVKSFVDGMINPDDASSKASSAPSAPSSVRATVDVRNATGVIGIGQTTLTTLVGHGFLAGAVADAARSAISSIHYAPGEQAAAAEVASLFGDSVVPQLDSTVAAGHVRLDLGTDYLRLGNTDGGGGPSSAAPPSVAPITTEGENCVN